jgi:hypothetical protein
MRTFRKFRAGTHAALISDRGTIVSSSLLSTQEAAQAIPSSLPKLTGKRRREV